MMTTGHLAWAFVPTETTLSQWLHFFARSTVILACFLVVQGFTLSRDLSAYLKRLFYFALLAQVPYAIMQYDFSALIQSPILIVSHLNVLFTLLFSLLALMAIHAAQNSRTLLHKCAYYAAVILLMALAYILKTDWDYAAIAWTLGIYLGGVWGFWIATGVLVAVSVWAHWANIPDVATFSGQWMDFGIVIAPWVMAWYQKNKHKSPKSYRLPRMLFYWYYVLHALVIGILSAMV